MSDQNTATELTEAEQEQQLARTMRKVRALIARAEHPATPPEEADSARRMADSMMLKDAIDSAMVRDAAPGLRQKPKSVVVGMGLGGTGAMSWISYLARYCASHCRVFLAPGWTHNSETREWETTAYGWSGDIQYFEVLYATLRIHMLGVLIPRPDPDKTLGQNMYAMHSAGYDWREVAGFYGWHLTETRGVIFRHESTGEERQYSSVVGEYRRAYRDECEARGEKPTTIHHSETFREDASRGYVVQIERRLRRLARERDAEQAGALVLASAVRDLEDYAREQNAKHYTRCPACNKLSANEYTCDRCGEKISDRPERPVCPKCQKAASGHCRDHPKGRSGSYRDINMAAYGAGVAHANTADLGGGKVGGDHRGELGG